MPPPTLQQLRSRGFTVTRVGNQYVARNNPIRFRGTGNRYQVFYPEQYTYDLDENLVEGRQQQLRTIGRGLESPYNRITYRRTGTGIEESVYGTGRYFQQLLEREVTQDGQRISRIQSSKLTPLQKENLQYRQARQKAKRVGIDLTRQEYRNFNQFQQTAKGQELKRRLNIREERILRTQLRQEQQQAQEARKIKERITQAAQIQREAKPKKQQEFLVKRFPTEKKLPSREKRIQDTFIRQLQTQGYKNIKVDSQGNIEAVKGDTKKVITWDYFRSFIVPKEAKVDIKRIPTKRQQEIVKLQQERKVAEAIESLTFLAPSSRTTIQQVKDYLRQQGREFTQGIKLIGSQIKSVPKALGQTLSNASLILNLSTKQVKQTGQALVKFNKFRNTVRTLAGKKTLTNVEKQKLQSSYNEFKDSVQKVTKKDIRSIFNREVDKAKYATYIGLRFSKGFAEFSIDTIMGTLNILEAGILTASETKNFVETIYRLGLLKKQVKDLAQKERKSKQDLKKIQNNVTEFRKISSKLIKSPKLEKAKKLWQQENTKLAAFMLGATVVGIGAGATGGLVAGVAKVALGTIGLVATITQAGETVKKPTPENWGRLAFFALPTFTYIAKTTIKALSPKFKFTVKNVSVMKQALQSKVKSNNQFIKSIGKRKYVYINNKKVPKNTAIKRIRRINQLARKAIEDANWILKNKNAVAARDFNPRVHAEYLRRQQGVYKGLYHVSTEAQSRKLFGKEVEKIISLRKLLNKVGTKGQIRAKELKPLGLPLTEQRKISQALLGIIKDKGLAITGSYAQNLYVKPQYRRIPKDFDVHAKNNKKAAIEVARALKKIFPNKRITVTKQVKAYKIKVNGRAYMDIVKIRPNEKFITYKGFKIVSKRELIRGKLEGVVKRRQRVGLKDLKDLLRLSEGKVKVKDVLAKTKNPSDTFQVVRQTKGMGRSRLAFDETHMYFDYEAAVAYSYGKPYSIIKFPLQKISKFPKRLRGQIIKSISGQLKTTQQVALRKALNRYIKANPKKFFISPTTGTTPIPEREFVLAEGSKFFKGNLYNTFDNDLQKFITIVEVGFKKPRKISYFKALYNAYKNKPFRTLKYRLSNPDLLKVRRYAKILQYDLGFKKKQGKFLALLKKVIFFKKKPVIPKVKKKKRVIKKPTKKPKRIAKKKLVKKVVKEIKRRRKAVKRIPKPKIRVKKPRLKTRAVKRVPTRKTTRAKVRAKKRVVARKATRKREPTRPRKPTRVRKPLRKTERPRTRIPSRTTTRARKRVITRPRVRVRKRVPARTRVRVRTRVPPKPTTTVKPLVNLAWDKKLPRGYKHLVNAIIRIKGVNREIKLNTTPNRALRRIISLVDKTTTRSFQLKIVGVKKTKDIKRPSLQKFRLKKSRGSRVLKVVEKTKYAIDTKGEKRQLAIARALSPTLRKKIKRRRKNASKVQKRKA